MSAVAPLIRARTPGWWGMVLFLATEATMFGVMFASYYYLRFQWGPTWPPEGIPEPKVVPPSISTAILLGSSIPMAIAASTVGRRTRILPTLAVAAAFVLGSIFLWLTASQIEKNVQDFTPQDHAYGSLFYTIVVAHSVHVLAGLAIALGILGVLWTGAYGRRSRIAVATTALYWHSVNALAVAVLVLIYLVPAFS